MLSCLSFDPCTFLVFSYMGDLKNDSYNRVACCYRTKRLAR